jgi:hypothetical protein
MYSFAATRSISCQYHELSSSIKKLIQKLQDDGFEPSLQNVVQNDIIVPYLKA